MGATILSYVLHELHRLSPGLVYGLVALLVFGEAALFIGFVLPGETSVIVAGVVASQGRVNVAALCALVVAAAVLGDTVGYAVGRRWGQRLLRVTPIAKRRADVDRALEALRRRGPAYVVVGRFTAFLRAVMPGLAGMSEMRYARFLAANAAGGLVWGVAFTLLGYFAGGALTRIENVATWVGLGVLVAVLAFWATLLVRRRRRERRSGHQAG